MKKLLALLVASAFATSVFAVDASAPASADQNGAAKTTAPAAKHTKKHKKSKKHHKTQATKKAASE